MEAVRHQDRNSYLIQDVDNFIIDLGLIQNLCEIHISSVTKHQLIFLTQFT